MTACHEAVGRWVSVGSVFDISSGDILSTDCFELSSDETLLILHPHPSFPLLLNVRGAVLGVTVVAMFLFAEQRHKNRAHEMTGSW